MVVILGEEYHRTHPSLLTDQLYLSAARAITARVLMDLGITCIINATLELPTMAYQKQECLQIAVEDRVASKLYVYFDLVADKINSVHLSGGKLLVYCRAGQSRSASLCIAYFIKYHGMNLHDAYEHVRARRPIIHPNEGFMRQLREFETKVRTKKSHSDLMLHAPFAKRRKGELPPLSYATEHNFHLEMEDLFDYDLMEYEPAVQTVPRVKKKRRPKVIESIVTDLCAEVYQVTPVQVCEDISSNDPSSFFTAEKPDIGIHHGSPNETSLCLAEHHKEIPLEKESSFVRRTLSARRKAPFTKISEPAKIAVSHFHLPLECCAFQGTRSLGQGTVPSNYFTTSNLQGSLSNLPQGTSGLENSTNIDHVCSSPFNNTINNISAAFLVFTELHALPQKSEEIAFECLGNVPDEEERLDNLHEYEATSTTTTTTTPSAAAKARNVKIKAKAKATICPSSYSIASISQIVLLDCNGIYKREKLTPGPSLNQNSDSKTSKSASTKPLLQRTNSKRGFTSSSSAQFQGPQPVPMFGRKLQRTGSIKTPGLRISAVPEKRQKAPITVIPPFMTVCTSFEPPMLIEQCLDNIPSVTHIDKHFATIVLTKLLQTATICDVKHEIFQIVERDHHSKLKTDLLATIARPLIILKQPLEVRLDNVAEEVIDRNIEIISKKYPYYDKHRVLHKNPLALFSAKEEPAIETCYFFPLQPRKSTKAVQLVQDNKPAESVKFKAKLPRLVEPTLNWASERSEYIDVSEYAKPLRGLEFVKAQRTTSVNEAVEVCELRELDWLALIPRFRACYYNYWSLLRMCNHPWYEVATISENTVLKMNNFYYEPVTFAEKAEFKIEESVNESIIETDPEVHDDLIDLVEIPDVMGSVEEIKSRIVNQRDPVKLSIWLDVFKRSVIRTRPIYPFIRISEMFPVTDHDENILLEESFEFANEFESPKEKAVLNLTDLSFGFETNLDFTSNEIAYDETPKFTPETINRVIEFNDDFIVCEERNLSYDEMVSELGVLYQDMSAFALPSIESASSHEITVSNNKSCENTIPIEDANYRSMKRKAFKILTRLQPTVSVRESYICELITRMSPIEPNGVHANFTYQSANEVDEYLDDISLVDTFWFFQMATDKETANGNGKRRSRSQTTSAVNASRGKYQLFMPDPDMVDRLGEEADEFSVHDINDDGSRPLTTPTPMLKESIPEIVSKELKTQTSLPTGYNNSSVNSFVKSDKKSSNSSEKYENSFDNSTEKNDEQRDSFDPSELVQGSVKERKSRAQERRSTSALKQNSSAVSTATAAANTNSIVKTRNSNSDSPSISSSSRNRTSGPTATGAAMKDRHVSFKTETLEKSGKTKYSHEQKSGKPQYSRHHHSPITKSASGSSKIYGQSVKKSTSSEKIVSYQRPRVHSKSRGSGSTRSAEIEAKTLEHLQTSLNESSALLERRRHDRASDIAAYQSKVSYLTRQNTDSQINTSSMRNRAGQSDSYASGSSAGSKYSSDRYNTTPDNEEGSVSLRGILNVAQSWLIGSGKTRRERSMDRSRSLIRKSKVS